MSDRIHLEIITPEKVLLETDVDWVTLPGSEGELGVLPEHLPLSSSLASGWLRYSVDDKVSRVAVHYGFLQVEGSRVTVLSEMAETSEHIDANRAQDAERRAREKLEELLAKQNEEEIMLAKYESKLHRAMVRQQSDH